LTEVQPYYQQTITSWLPVSFLLHVKYTRIVSYRKSIGGVP